MREWEIAVVVAGRTHAAQPDEAARALQEAVRAAVAAIPGLQHVVAFSVAEVVDGEVDPDQKWDA